MAGAAGLVYGPGGGGAGAQTTGAKHFFVDEAHFYADEHLWAWVREEVTANTCLGTAEQVRAHVDPFFAGLAARKDEVTRRCRTELQSRADALDAARPTTTVLKDSQEAA